MTNQHPNPAPPVSDPNQQAPPPAGMPQNPNQIPPAPGQPPLGYQPRQTNTMSIIALAVTFVIPVLGLVLGIIALNQIKKTHEDGRVLAIIAIVINALQMIVVIFWILAFSYIYTNADDITDDWRDDFKQTQIEEAENSLLEP